jgi:hypothetical protein
MTSKAILTPALFIIGGQIFVFRKKIVSLHFLKEF